MPGAISNTTVNTPITTMTPMIHNSRRKLWCCWITTRIGTPFHDHRVQFGYPAATIGKLCDSLHNTARIVNCKSAGVYPGGGKRRKYKFDSRRCSKTIAPTARTPCTIPDAPVTNAIVPSGDASPNKLVIAPIA